VKSPLIVMAGGGTGGHVIPAIAVAREVVRTGAEVLFVGTDRGAEGRLVPAAGFRLEKIRVGGLKNLGIATRIVSLWRLFAETVDQVGRFGHWEPAAVFSMGGYVAGPPVLAALLRKVPLVVMEPNAVPGFTNRHIARWVTRALINFEETKRFFPPGRTELTGLPVRDEFFRLAPKRDGDFTVLITGGSQGSRTLNRAAQESWPLFREAGLRVTLIHQTGPQMQQEVATFIDDMPGAFARADLIVCRAGAGAVNELAAAGKPSILIPFPFAADQHQLKNAQAFERAGAARLYTDGEWNGRIFFDNVKALSENRAALYAMGENARRLARPGAARRAAEILSEISLTQAPTAETI
jgi:UDP-N-acetylglucosamine--N-acetylmuramyl-(pentapeptide) pyrophosphoryl-undecaprenol N-acetylglucosamine transferase